MKKIYIVCLILVLLSTLVACGPTKEDILDDLQFGLLYETSSYDEVDDILIEKSYLPADFYFICDDIKERLPIVWTCDSNDISLIRGAYSYDGPEYTIFSEKLYTNPYYAIEINNYNDSRSKYNLTATVNYKKVTYSKTFIINVGSKKDFYMGNVDNWGVDGDILKYLKETYRESNGNFQGKPNTTRTVSKGEFDEKTGKLYYQYVKKKYIYPSTNTSETHVFEYNVKTKELTYENIILDLSKRYTIEDYNAFLAKNVDCKFLTESGFLKLIKDLDGYFEYFNMTDSISIFSESKEYNYQYLFDIPEE